MADPSIDYQRKMQALGKELSHAQGHITGPNGQVATQVDLVEFQAMRQQLQTVEHRCGDLQKELEAANAQNRKTEDELEDRNDRVDALSTEIEMLKADLLASETKRRDLTTTKRELEAELTTLSRDLNASVEVQEALVSERPKQRFGLGAIIGSLIVGGVLATGGLEGLSMQAGRGELIGSLLAGADSGGRIPPIIPDQTASSKTAANASPSVATVVASDGAIATDHIAPAKEVGELVQDEALGLTWVKLPGGRFEMGNRNSVVVEETPVHPVDLKPFAISQTEVPFSLYDRFVQETGRTLPSDNGWGRELRPVINVNWDDVQAFVSWLSEKTGQRYRLPSESEWEYAAAAGTQSQFWWGSAVGNNQANCFNCGSNWDGEGTAPVDTFSSSPYGLKSTAGNVREWVQDCYRAGYEGAPADGTAVALPDCAQRVVRGGAFNMPATSMRVTKRTALPADSRISSVGFRLVREF